MLDLYVCAYASENRLYLNRGDGTFVERAKACGLSFIGANVKMAFADYDLDGDLDAYLVTNRREPIGNPKVEYEGGPGTYTVKEPYRELVSVINLPGGEQKFTKAGQFDHLFKNLLVETGRLNFVDVSKNAGIEGPDHGLDVTWWDYDADGYPDLYVSNDFTDPDKFYRNRGDGTFENILATALPHTPWFTMGSATGDLNNDGRLDLVPRHRRTPPVHAQCRLPEHGDRALHGGRPSHRPGEFGLDLVDEDRGSRRRWLRRRLRDQRLPL
jgi:hypothetical protein